MASCPICATEYPEGTATCPRDGAQLASDPAERAEEAATAPAVSGEVSAAAAAVKLAESEAFDALIGSALAGRYLIVRRIGEGGMGAVYEAKHTVIGKRVAVKVLLEKFHSNSDLVARLLQEARLASSIGHENIVDVTDFGTTDDGRSFVVMEFLEGEPLAQLIMREAPLPVERSLRIARQVASALGAAHAKGIYHRDVKPENVYLIQRGDADFVKVVDFGISKAVKQGGEDPAESYRLTHTGLLLGTPLYMSPEQARGEDDLDHRVDIWALGVMLYECLTGEVPFHANNYLGIISQVLTREAPPPSHLRPELGIPQAVETVTMRAMEKNRQLRYQTMADLQLDLERLLAGDQNVGLPVAQADAFDMAVPPVESGPRRWHLVIAGALVMVVGIAMALRRPSDAHPGAEAPAAAAATAPAPPPPARAAPPPVAASAAPATVTPPSAAPPEAARLVSARRKPARVERKPVGTEKAAAAPRNEPKDSDKRGMPSPTTKEAYPD
ncbi:MAG TPA: serine/threonine-protein kinase [Polyangia bacterium]|jgi:serine/threonine-protein kinase|nr:serine/threonine-protein kinase [Polyangia bacterium]